MSNLLIQEEPLLVLPGLAEQIGLNNAVVLQQVHYWLNKSSHQYEGRRWIYNSYDEWQKQFPFWSTKTVQRIFEALEGKNLIITGNFNKSGFDKTKWYSINYDQLNIMSNRYGQSDQTIRTSCPMDVDRMTKPIPETTTEITSEIVVSNSAPTCDGILLTEQKEISHGELDAVDNLIDLYCVQYRNQKLPSTRDINFINNTLALDSDSNKIIALVEKCLKEFVPAYPGDEIRTFKYCESYVRNNLNEKKSREEAMKNAKNAVNSRSNPINGTEQPKTSSETKRLEAIAREKGLTTNGEIRNIDCDF